MSVDSLAKEWHETRDMIKAGWAYIGGSLDSWAIILEENPEMQETVIKDMKEMAAKLREKAGVTIDPSL